MMFHAGIYPADGRVSYYDESNNDIVNNEINIIYETEIEKIPLMYEEIKSIINGKLGYACICLAEWCGNTFRKKIIAEGLKCGFKNVEIINWETVIYVYAVERSLKIWLGPNEKPNYTLSNENVIWIFDGYCFYLWNIINDVANFIGKWVADNPKLDDLQTIMDESKLNKGPDILLYSSSGFNKAHFEKLSKCKLFFWDIESSWFSRASFLKAQITAGNSDIIQYDVTMFLSKNISLRFDDEEVTSFEYGQALPVFFFQKIIKKSSNNILKVVSGFKEETFFPLPDYDEIYLTFRINKNEIYSVTFSDKPNEDESINEEEILGLLEYYTIPSMTNPTNVQTNAVGIDLGTSRCCVAVNRKNGITTVPLDNNGDRLLPSYISYDETNVKCGKVVMKRLRNYSKSTIFDSKRIIGRTLKDIEIDAFWPFYLSHENDIVFLEIETINGKRKITAEEAASDLLKFIKQKSEEFQGMKLTKTVITVPSAFNNSQRVATMAAAKLSGWEQIVLLPEPIAASFAYFIDRPISDSSNVLLFDLGGGTLDVCVFKIENNEIEIITSIGDSNIGGKNFDTILINYFITILNADFGISLSKERMYKLMIEAQAIKEDLSSIANVLLNVDEYDPAKNGQISINREEFENMTKPLINKIQNTIHSALFKSNLKENQINKVLHVGGGSRMPVIKKLLGDIFSEAEHCIEEHPDEVVAIGAAYYACSIFSD